MAATRSRMDEAATPASTSPERNSPALFRTSLIEPNAYVVPKRTVFSFTAAPRKKRCPEAARRGWRRPGRGWTGLPPRAWGCGGLREAGMCGGKRPRPRGGRPCPKVPLRGGPLSAPQGCRACATRERAPGIFPKSKAYRTHQGGRGSSPSHQAGDGRAAGTPSARIQPPPHAGNGCKPTFPAFSDKPAARAGNGPPAGSHWRGRPPHRNGAGSAGGIRETQAPAARAGS